MLLICHIHAEGTALCSHFIICYLFKIALQGNKEGWVKICSLYVQEIPWTEKKGLSPTCLCTSLHSWWWTWSV